MHTPLCRHATGEPMEYAAYARQVRLDEIGFSDHSPMPQDDFDDWRMNLSQLDDYVEKVRSARAGHPELVIKLALEVDFLPGHEEWIRELARRHPWDYFIGSVHYVTAGWAIDNPAMVSEWQRHDPAQVWSGYVERLIQATASGLFEIVGHVDLPKKFGFYPPGDFLSLFDRFLEVARQQDVAIELNTAGWRKDCREIYPSRPLLERAYRQGVPITFGSDAHTVREVGKDFDLAVALARSVGYTQCCRFTQRQRELVPL